MIGEIQPKVIEIPAYRQHAAGKNRPNPGKRRVCAYCRVSTDETCQVSSFELQKSHYELFIKSRIDWEFAGIYADFGKSATSTHARTEFRRMIDDCKAGKVDLILTKSISRFARNTIDCLSHIRDLKYRENPVGIFFEKENLDTLDPKNEILLTILSSLAQEEARSNSENLKWSIRKGFQSGKARCPTRYLLGYDKDENGNMVICEEEAAVVRRIYKDYLSGKGAKLIAKELRAEGVPSSRGGSNWGKTSVLHILRNEKYCGDVLMQKTYTIDFLSHKRMENKGQLNQYLIEDHHPPIISRDEWNAVQTELSRRIDIANGEPGSRQSYSGTSPMSNRLYCGHCGQPLIRCQTELKGGGQKRKVAVFRCRATDKKARDRAGCSPCYAKRKQESKLEADFMTMMARLHEERSKYEGLDEYARIANFLDMNGQDTIYKPDLFRELIEKALVFDDGKITWIFKSGFEYECNFDPKKRRRKMTSIDIIQEGLNESRTNTKGCQGHTG